MEAEELAKNRLVVLSPKTGVGLPTEGSVLYMATVTASNGDVVPANPVEYAKKVILFTAQEPTTVKLSATEKPEAILAPYPALVFPA